MISLLPNTRRHDITFHRNGRIDIAARIVRLLNIRPGDVIDILKDGVEYYLRVRLRASAILGRHHAKCYPTAPAGNTAGTYRAWSRQLTDAIINTTDPTANTIRLPCGDPIQNNTQTLIPIITRNPL